MELHAGRDPRQAPDWEQRAPNWETVLETLWQAGWLRPNVLELSELGQSEAKKLSLLYPRGLPKPASPCVHVGPLATGSSLQKSDRIWDELVQHQRLLQGLDMEGSVIGFVGWAENVDHLVVKGVMDFAEPGRTHRFKAFAARAAAEVLLELLRKVLVSTEPTGQELLSSHLLPPVRTTPSALLSARHAVVPFDGESRKRELGDLGRWCDSRPPDLPLGRNVRSGRAGRGFRGPWPGEGEADRGRGLHCEV
jgi:hypothetical protein